MPNPPSAAHKLAFDIFVDRIIGYVASYFVKLDGAVDAIVFAGGIGERSAMLRKAIVEKVRCLGVPPVDEGANERGFGDEEGKNVVDVSGGREGPRVLVCQTDEQVSPFFLSFLFFLFFGYVYADFGVVRDGVQLYSYLRGQSLNYVSGLLTISISVKSTWMMTISIVYTYHRYLIEY